MNSNAEWLAAVGDGGGRMIGEKQRIDRSYDFIGVIEWFAARCDVILLLFDPHKLDISDEFKAAISALRGHDDKVTSAIDRAARFVAGGRGSVEISYTPQTIGRLEPLF